MAFIAATYASAIHLWIPDAPYTASLTAILGAFALSFVIWSRFHERRGKKGISGVILGGLCGCCILVLGPSGFGIEDAIFNTDSDALSKLLYIPAISIAAFPLFFLVMHGWTVVLAGVILGGGIEGTAHRHSDRSKGKD